MNRQQRRAIGKTKFAEMRTVAAEFKVFEYLKDFEDYTSPRVTTELRTDYADATKAVVCYMIHPGAERIRDDVMEENTSASTMTGRIVIAASQRPEGFP